MDIFIGLIPIVITILSVFLFKKVLLGLLIGIICSMTIISIKTTDETAFVTLWDTFVNIFSSWDSKVMVIAFLYFASISSAIMVAQGGTSSLADKFVNKVKSKKRTLFIIAIIGVLIFVDGLLNSLIVGSSTKHISDKHKVSRAKLSYIVDSTSSPMASLIAFSSWGSYITTLLSNMDGIDNPVMPVITAAFTQYYEIFAIAIVFIVVFIKFDIGPMKKYEQAFQTGEDISLIEDKNDTKPTNSLITILPLVIFVITVTISWIAIAYIQDTSLLDTYFNLPLALGTLTMLLTSIMTSKILNKNFTWNSIYKTTKKSFWKTSKGMILLIILVWILADQIGVLNLGDNIADAIIYWNINIMWIPLVLFIMASIISFSLGTSWGTFGLLIPIFIPIAVKNNDLHVSVALSAILGGSVFGDHCSPISDTTIVSASSTGSSLKAHFTSQIPYALLAGGNAIVGYITYAIAGNLWLPGLVTLISFIITIWITWYFANKNKLMVKNNIL